MKDPITSLGPEQDTSEPRGNLHSEKPIFGFKSETPHRAYLSTANANPFALLGTIDTEEENPKISQEETGERWVFQAGRKQASRATLPGQASPLSPTHATKLDSALGSRRKRTRSEMHRSFFTSLGISIPPGQEFARARIWPILSRERDEQREILVCVKNKDLPNLPLHIRCTSASEEEWTPMSALEELTRDVESELEENILRFSLSLKGRLTLEWSWQEDQTKGGWECTILAHINTGQSGISAQKRRNLHWRTLESISGMNNDIAFAGPAHGLLLKTGPTSLDRQIRKSASASLLTSPQAARKKKRYVKLDLSALVPSSSADLFQTLSLGRGTDQGELGTVRQDPMGSIGLSAAQTCTDHV
jgi:hypothetical protein